MKGSEPFSSRMGLVNVAPNASPRRSVIPNTRLSKRIVEDAATFDAGADAFVLAVQSTVAGGPRARYAHARQLRRHRPQIAKTIPTASEAEDAHTVSTLKSGIEGPASRPVDF